MKSLHARSLGFGLLLGVGLSVGAVVAARSINEMAAEKANWHFVVSGSTPAVDRFIDAQSANHPTITLERLQEDRRHAEASFGMPPVERNGQAMLRLTHEAFALHLSYGFTLPSNAIAVPARAPAHKAATQPV